MVGLLSECSDYLNGTVSLAGNGKTFSNIVVGLLLSVYFVLLCVISIPVTSIVYVFWVYCIALAALVIFRPHVWIAAVFGSIPVLGFLSNVLGATDAIMLQHLGDGSLLKLAYFQIGDQARSEFNGNIFSIPILGLPISVALWWLVQQKVSFPRVFVLGFAWLVWLTISSVIGICSLYEVSIFPLKVEFAASDILQAASAVVGHRVTLSPSMILASTFKIWLANTIGFLLSIVIYNLLVRGISFSYLYYGFSAGFIVAIFYGFGQMYGLVPEMSHSPMRYESTFLTLGGFTLFVGFMSVFYFANMFAANSFKRVVGSFFLFAISLVGFEICKARTVVWALMASIPICLMLWFIRYKWVGDISDLLRLRILGVCAGVVMFSVIAISVPNINHYMQQSAGSQSLTMRVLETFDFERSDFNRLSGGREFQWKLCLEIWKERPLVGCGSGQLPWYLLNKTYVADNEFILELTERGVIGLIFYLMFVLSIFVSSMFAVLKLPDKLFMVWFPWACSFWAIFAQMFTMGYLYNFNFTLIFYGVVAVLVYLNSQKMELVEEV